MSGGGAERLVGSGRSLADVVGAGRPTGRPIPCPSLPPLPVAAVGFRGERRCRGVNLRGEGRRRGKDRRLARWSLPERISYFQLPDRPFLQPLPIVGSLLLFLPASPSSLYLYFLFSPPPPPATQTVTLRLLVGDCEQPLLRAPLRFSDISKENEVWLSFEGVTDNTAPGFFGTAAPHRRSAFHFTFSRPFRYPNR